MNQIVVSGIPKSKEWLDKTGINIEEQVTADYYAEVSNEYELLMEEKIPKDLFQTSKSTTIVDEDKVFKVIKIMYKKAETVVGDFPMALIEEYSDFLISPLAHIINQCFSQGKQASSSVEKLRLSLQFQRYLLHLKSKI